MEAGFIALWQTCPHLGCRVPQCVTSQWFECPCHGSQYNRVGEKKGGPAPRGMDRFAMQRRARPVTSWSTPARSIQGPPIGTNTTGQEAEGPHCIGRPGATAHEPRQLARRDVQQTFGLVLAGSPSSGPSSTSSSTCGKARPEVGAEIELAPNRKPYYDDEELEGPRLDRFLTFALVLLGVTAVALPLYWLAEPGRQADPIKRFEAIFASRGEEEFDANCSSCHGQGATGGVAAYVLQDKAGNFLANVTYNAPALNNALLRFDRDEVQYVLDHGRAFSPMQPWSTVGGGSMNAQQTKNIIDYLESITITSDEAHEQVAEGLEAMRERYPSASEGELLFNLQANSGSYSCARCHTQGWSYGRPGPTGSGAFGPKLYSVVDKFNSVEDLQDFLSEGCELGALYGRQSQCKSGQMPAFGEVYTAEQLEAVAEYVATLDGSQQFDPNAGTAEGSGQ